MVQQKLVSSEKTNKDEGIHQDKPELRFPEFTDSWKIIKIEDNAIIKGRIGWKNLKSEEYTDEGPYLIAGKHIKNGIINWDECDHITIERYDESPEIALKDGDIIFSKDGSLGNPSLIRNLGFEATINGTMMLVRLDQNKINPNYFYQVLNSDYFFRLLHILKSGSSIPHIFQRDMVNFKFPICSLEEQKKISIFLEKIDKKIELLEKKLFLYQELDLSFKNQIFNSFKTSSFIKLNDLCQIKKGKQLNKSDMINNGEYYVLNGGKEPSGYTNSWNVEENTITISEGGNSCGFVSYNTEKFFCGGHCYYLILKENNMDLYYLFHYLKYIEPKIMKLRVGSGLPNIQKGDVENINILELEYEKQKEIGNFFEAINTKIVLNLKEKEKLEKYKKSLLQKMFV